MRKNKNIFVILFLIIAITFNVKSVKAYDTTDYIFTMNSFNYEHFDYQHYYDNSDLFKKIDIVIDYFHSNFDQEQFGITVIISPTFQTVGHNELDTDFSSGSNYNSKIMFHFYDKNKISLSTDASFDIYNRFRVLKYSATRFYSGNFTKSYTADSPIWTYSLDDFKTYVEEGNIYSWFTWTTEPNTSTTTTVNQTVDLRPNEFNVSIDSYSRDIIYYYSDVDIKYTYYQNYLKFNDTILSDNDSIPIFYNWLNSNRLDYSLLAEYQKICSHGNPVGIGSDNLELYNTGSIIFDVDISYLGNNALHGFIYNYDIYKNIKVDKINGTLNENGFYYHNFTITDRNAIVIEIRDSQGCYFAGGSTVCTNSGSGTQHGGGGGRTLDDLENIVGDDTGNYREVCFWVSPGFTISHMDYDDYAYVTGLIMTEDGLTEIKDSNVLISINSTSDVFDIIKSYFNSANNYIVEFIGLFTYFYNELPFPIKSFLVSMFVIIIICNLITKFRK